MTHKGHRYVIVALSLCVAMLAVLAAWQFYCSFEVVLADGRAQVVEEIRDAALAKTNVLEVAVALRHANRWYGSVWPRPSESHAQSLLRRVRVAAVRDLIAHLRRLTGRDLGDDPKVWIAVYAPADE